MRATLIFGAGDIRVDNVPGPVVQTPSDALVRVTTASICGSDLHPYGSMDPHDGPVRIGHEFIGIVEEIGAENASKRSRIPRRWHSRSECRRLGSRIGVQHRRDVQKAAPGLHWERLLTCDSTL